MYRKLSAPVIVQWEITPACNHNCFWCYNFWRKGPPLPVLPNNYKKLFQKVVDEIIRNKVFSMVITGGEPLLVIKEATPYIKQLSDAGIIIYLNSNLTLLNSETASLLSKIGVKSILSSLPSANPETCDQITNTPNTVTRTTKGIKAAINEGLPVMVNMVVCHENLNQIKETAKYVSGLGVKGFAATRASNPVSGSDFKNQVLSIIEFRKLLSDLEEVGKKYKFRTDTIEANPPCAFGEEHLEKSHRVCSAGKNTLTVGYDGNIRACNRLPMIYGHIEEGLQKSWNEMEILRSNDLIPNECQSCKLKFRCGGGCKADALIEHNDLKKPDPLCDFSYFPEPKPWTIEPTEDNLFTINPQFKSRKEDFGGIVYSKFSDWLAVNHQTLRMLLLLEGTISLEEIAKALEIQVVSAKKTIALLVKKKILIPIKN